MASGKSWSAETKVQKRKYESEKKSCLSMSSVWLTIYYQMVTVTPTLIVVIEKCFTWINHKCSLLFMPGASAPATSAMAGPLFTLIHFYQIFQRHCCCCRLGAASCRVSFSLVPRPHPAHARRRGLVSQVPILGLAPETWSGQSYCRVAFIGIMHSYFNRTAQSDIMKFIIHTGKFVILH